MSIIDSSPLSDATLGNTGSTRTFADAIAYLHFVAGQPCDVIQAGRYQRFAPLVILYDRATRVAWLCAVSADGRLSMVEASAVAVWEERR